MMGTKGDRRRLAAVDEKEVVTVSTGDWSEDWTDRRRFCGSRLVNREGD